MMMMIDDGEAALLFLVGVVDLILFFGRCCCWILNLPVFVYGFQLFSLFVLKSIVGVLVGVLGLQKKRCCWCVCVVVPVCWGDVFNAVACLSVVAGGCLLAAA